MRFFHLSDLHIGRQLNGYSLRDNQEAVLFQIVEYAKKERPDAILICGDIYDKSVPSGEAVTVFDRFLNDLSDLEPEIPVLIIAGNHDSPERLSYASAFLEKHRIFLSAMPPREQDEHLKKVRLSDEFGEVDFYLLPFMKPGYVRPLIGDSAAGYESAFQAVLAREAIDGSRRNVLLAHQFFTAGGSGPELSDSEQTVLTAGGLDQIGVSVLEPFDYAALGHIHGPQRVGEERFRYCGTPFPYSVSEEHHKKSVTVVTLGKKGEEPLIEKLPLAGLQRVRRVTGTLSEVIAAARTDDSEAAGKCSDFVSITLTDEEERFDFREQLEEAYDHILEIRIDNERVRNRMAEDTEQLQVLNPYEAFSQFYEAVRHCPMTEEQEQLMKRIVEEAKEEEER